MKYEIINPADIPSSWYGQVTGLDIETEDLSINSRICLVSIYNPKENRGGVVPIYWYQDDKLFSINPVELDILKKFLSTIKAVGHNLHFDLSLIKYRWGVTVEPYFDTFIMARVFQFREQSLKGIISRLKPEWTADILKFDDLANGEPPFKYILDARTIKYSSLDAFYPFVLMNHFKDRIQKMKRIFQIEMNFMKVANGIRSSGLNIDMAEYFKDYEEMGKRVDALQNELDTLVGFHVRPTSSADIKRVFDVYNLVPAQLTPKGEPSTSTEAIGMMMENYLDRPAVQEVLQLILDLKHEFAVRNSCKKVPQWEIGGKLHPQIEQIGYDGTSRVYSTDPSVNQYPKELRYSIKPDAGKKFVMFDLKSAELYIAAYWSKCSLLLDWFSQGVDLHSEISKRLLGKDHITKEERAVSKVVTFSTIYGSEGAATARALHIPLDQAQDLVAGYMRLFPEIKNLRDRAIAYCHKTTYTKTMIGRPRQLPNIKSAVPAEVRGAERQAFNTAIQASCADFFKIAAARTLKYPNVKFVFGVFDSFLLEVPEEMTDAEMVAIMDEMVDFSNLYPNFKFRYDWAVGHSWGEAYEGL